MDILLWRWSTAVQLTSAFMIAVFFVALSRSVRRPEVLWWRRAWIADFAALAATLVFWYLGPKGFAERIVYAAYLAAKLAFVVLIAEGAWVARHAGRTLLTTRQRTIILTAYALIGAAVLRSLMVLGLVQHTLLAILFIATAIAWMRVPERRAIWLAAGLVVRALVGVAEAAAYAIATQPSSPLAQEASVFLAASSSFDTGAEWLLALGCVLVISDRVQRELELSNRDLLAAQDELRALADRDPLTALSNRRALPAALRAVQPAGATILFFDLDDFKEVNDVHGHEAGDQCLKSFAAALRASFRPADAIVRYGGDEFLVVASGLDASSIEQRIALVRQRVAEGIAIPRISFSVGRAELPPGGNPNDALREADAAMYDRKRREKLSAGE